MIKVTFEYATVDEAIVALAKLVGAPVKATAGSGHIPGAVVSAPTSTRRGRSDKGQARGSYKNPPQNANVTNVPEATTVAATAIGTGVADTAGKAQLVPQSSAGTTDPVRSTTPEPVVLAPEPAAPAVKDASGTAPTPVSDVTPAAAAHTVKDLQEAIGKVFNTKGLPVALQVLSRFGANTYRDIKPEQYAEFIKHAVFVSEGGAV